MSRDARPLQRQVGAALVAPLPVAQIAQRDLAAPLDPRALAVNDDVVVLDDVQPGPILVIVAGVDDDHVLIRPAPVNHRVVNAVAVHVQEKAIQRLADRECGHIVGLHQVEERAGIGAARL